MVEIWLTVTHEVPALRWSLTARWNRVENCPDKATDSPLIGAAGRSVMPGWAAVAAGASMTLTARAATTAATRRTGDYAASTWMGILRLGLDARAG